MDAPAAKKAKAGSGAAAAKKADKDILYFWALGGPKPGSIIKQGHYRGGPIVSPIFASREEALAHRDVDEDGEPALPGWDRAEEGRASVVGTRVEDWDGRTVYAATVCRCESVYLGVFGTHAAAQEAGEAMMEEFEPDVAALNVVT